MTKTLIAWEMKNQSWSGYKTNHFNHKMFGSPSTIQNQNKPILLKGINPFSHKILLPILLTVNHTIPIMLVLRIWYWIN